MQLNQDASPAETYKGVRVKADPFFIRSTSLLPQQIILRIGDYNLAVAPAYFSFEEVSLLLVLSTEELALFSRFVTGTCSLLLVFDLPGAKEAVRLLLRAGLSVIDPMKGRTNICMATLRLKTLPPLYVDILSSFFGEMETRKQKRDLLADNWVEAKGEGALAWSAELLLGSRRVSVSLDSLSTKKARIRLAEDIDVADEPAPVLRIIRGTSVFSVPCAALPGRSLGAGAVALDLDFSNELISLVEECLRTGSAAAPG